MFFASSSQGGTSNIVDRTVVPFLLSLAILLIHEGTTSSASAGQTASGKRSGGSDKRISHAGREAARGREAGKPTDIPAAGWKDISYRVYRDLSENQVGQLAAAVAFYGLLAMFPGLAALVSTYGLFAAPSDANHLTDLIGGVLPSEASKLIGDFLKSLVEKPASNLSLAAIVGFVLTLWSAHSGASSLMSALNVTHEEKEKRGFVMANLIALLFTIGAIIFIILALGLVAVLPPILQVLPLGPMSKTIADIARWPVLALLVIIALSAIYRYAPSREQPKWRWVSPGAVFATVAWLIASLGFSFYTAHFGSYDKTYGSFGAIIVLMMWLYISTYIILIGSELNAEIEHQTTRDTTKGPETPMGTRKAKMADTLGAASS